MTSRTHRHRYSRRRWATVLQVSTGGVQVELEAQGVSQSFLIMPGKSYTLALEGFQQGFGGFRKITVPVVIRAHAV